MPSRSLRKLGKITAVEATRRMDKALRRANSTPPKPYTPDLIPRKRGKPADGDTTAKRERTAD
jgi:hypothetical protein